MSKLLKNKTITDPMTIIPLILIGGCIILIVLQTYNNRISNDNSLTSQYYNQIDHEEMNHQGIKINENHYNNNKGVSTIYTKWKNLSVDNNDLNIVNDNNKAGLLEVITYQAKDKLISIGMNNTKKEYIIYLPN